MITIQTRVTVEQGVAMLRVPSEIAPGEHDVVVVIEGISDHPRVRLRCPKSFAVGLLRPHVLVGYRWLYIGLCTGCKSRYIRSFISQPHQIRICVGGPGTNP